MFSNRHNFIDFDETLNDRKEEEAGIRGDQYSKR
jgi:hypothetical protein